MGGNTQTSLAEPGHLHRLISVFTVHLKMLCILGYIYIVPAKTDQIALRHRLILVFAQHMQSGR